MPVYQLLRCSVALGGDAGTTVVRDRTQPIMFPELIVLQFIHGEEAITDVHVVGECEMSADEAMQRLVSIYGGDSVKTVFPGARPQLPRADGTIPICTKPIYTPAPTKPDSPEPKLRPLTEYTMNAPRVVAPPLPAEDEPTDAEIAANAQDEADPAQIDALANELGLGTSTKPTGAVLTQGRPSVASNRSMATRTGNLPDVASATHRQRTRVDETARG